MNTLSEAIRTAIHQGMLLKFTEEGLEVYHDEDLTEEITDILTYITEEIYSVRH